MTIDRELRKRLTQPPRPEVKTNKKNGTNKGDHNKHNPLMQLKEDDGRLMFSW